MKSADYSSSFNPFVYAEVPSDSVCLDVGCWTGSLGKLLIDKKNCVVDGIDVGADVLRKAKKNGYRNTYQINLNNGPPHLEKIHYQYQTIICADVLEHLIDPSVFLSQVKKYLKRDGIIIISLPNVAFILNRILLLLGKWDYREFGTLDKTHLRFFTIQSVSKMVESAGYTIIKVKPYNQFGLLRYLNTINNIYPSLFAYQTLIVAKK